MKVYINRRPGNRVSTEIFLTHLVSRLNSLNCPCFFDNQKADICLACIELSSALINRHLGHIIQRLDGIYLDTNINFNSMNKGIINTYKNTSGVIFQSDFCKKVITTNFGTPPGRSCVIHNGTTIYEHDSSFINRKHSNLFQQIKSYQIKIICAGKWRASKRIKSIINGFKYFNDNINNNSCLIIAGKVPQEYQQLLGKHIYCVGDIPNKHIAQFHYISDVCLNLSVMDACPNSIIEALAHGTPCVITKLQGVTELIDENNGVILDVDQWDYRPVSFTKHFHDIDPQIVGNAIQKCLSIGRMPVNYNLDISITAKKYIDFFKECL